MVNLTRIYTRTGDDGTTALGDMSRVEQERPPAHGLRRRRRGQLDDRRGAGQQGELPDDVRALLLRIQNDLFDVGADLCTPVVDEPAFPPLRVEQDYVDRLEAACDEYNEQLEKLRSFVLPGGTLGQPTCMWRAPCPPSRAQRPGQHSPSTATR